MTRTRRGSGSGLVLAGTEALNEREMNGFLSSIAFVFAMLCCSCSSVDSTRQDVTPLSSALPAEPRGIVGELCPPALAAKGYC